MTVVEQLITAAAVVSNTLIPVRDPTSRHRDSRGPIADRYRQRRRRRSRLRSSLPARLPSSAATAAGQRVCLHSRAGRCSLSDHPAPPVDSGRTPNPANYRISLSAAADRVFRATETVWAAAGAHAGMRAAAAVATAVAATVESTVAPCLPMEPPRYEGCED